MSLTYTAVRQVNLVPFSEAAAKWQKLGGQFRAARNTYQRTVAGPLEQSDWQGEAASAAFRKFTGVKSMMDRAAGEADDIGTVLAEALAKFTWAKDELKAIQEEVESPRADGGKSYLKLNRENGNVYVDPPPDEVDRSAALQKAFHEAIVAYRQRTLRAIEVATTADRRLSTALLIDPNGKDKGFTDDGIAHLNDVDKETEKDIKAAMNLADKGADANEKQISQLNGILAKHAKNSDFAEQFTLRMGPKGMLDYWAAMAEPKHEQRGTTSVTIEHSKERRAQLAALQDNLGVTLGLASHSDTPEMKAWKKEMIDMGDERIGAEAAKGNPYASKGPYNFQVMSNLMRTGNFQSDFLNDYGDALLKKDREGFVQGYEGNKPTEKWISKGFGDSGFLNFGSAKDAGEDPVTGFMEALGNNGNASTEFFLDKGNYDYLISDRDWPEDGEFTEPEEEKRELGGYKALSHALNSATTGSPYDAPVSLQPSHSEDEAKIMSRLIQGVSSLDDHTALKPGMHESVARAAAEYTPDIFRALKDGSDDKLLFPMEGAELDLKNAHLDTTRFLLALGQDPDGNTALGQAQKAYTAQVLEHHLSGDLPANQRYDASREDTVQEILRASGETAGTLAIGRQEAVIGPAVTRDAEFDKSTLSARLWGNTAFGTGVTAASMAPVFTAHPIAAASIGVFVAGAEGALVNDIDADISRSESIDKADAAARIWSSSQERDIQQNEAALKAIAEVHGVDVSNTWAEVYSKDGYGQALDRVATTATYLSSLDQVKSLPVDRPD
ncbi:PPE domain-containing protein [Streptomyces sp. N2-109]|uniref:PPE domain-containing protein n=1 Tax=Streptomyces gossypii TaxID=2883101 RepID=A0ABT2JRY8_9ACTN|nr:DUF6571 family protein [Streptomyces gossypii]MCT2590652.1 PPE domain-containing protein [Streptomyces gossypii]